VHAEIDMVEGEIALGNIVKKTIIHSVTDKGLGYTELDVTGIF